MEKRESLHELHSQQEKLHEKIRRIEELQSLEIKVRELLNGNSPEATVTHSANGTPRVRAYVVDEDAYMGYIEHSAFYGIAPSETEAGTYVLESYFPNSTSKSHYLWKFKPTEGTVLLQYRDSSQQEDGFELYSDPGERGQYFVPQLRNVLDTDRWSDLEGSISGDKKEKFAFVLPELA